MRIGLVADVPEDLVARGVEQRMQRDGQLAGAEVGAEVPADLADGVDDVLAHLLGELVQLLLGERVQVLRAPSMPSSSRFGCALMSSACR